MFKRLNRVSLTVRLLAAVVLAVILYIGVRELLDFYSEEVGFTPERAIQTYFGALASGDYAEVYRLTNKAHLTDIYGRSVTEQEFREQLRKVTGGRNLVFSHVRATKLFQNEGTRYYAVELHSSLGGTPSVSRVIVEVQADGRGWAITYPFAIIL